MAEGLRARIERLRVLLFGKDCTCAVCNADVFSDGHFCRRCLETLPWNAGFICEKCGRAIREDYPVCGECKAAMPEYDAARSVFRYEGEIIRLIKRFKTGERWLAEALAERMALLLLSDFSGAELLVCVPSTERARRRRGYNPPALLAEEVSRRTGVPFEENLLCKTRETAPQKALTRQERAKNLAGCFRVHERTKCRGKAIVLIDDVLTTGVTADTAARALRNAGARSVRVLTAASVPDRRPVAADTVEKALEKALK